MKKHLNLILAVLLVIVSGVAVFALAREEVVATVNGEKITKDELYQELVAHNGKYVLEQLISARVITQAAKKEGISVSDEEVSAELERMIEEHYGGSREYFELALSQYGLTEQTLKQSIRIDMLLTEMVRAKTTVTEEEVQKHFADNQDKFNIPHEVHARHILVKEEEKATEILQQLKAGADFAALAKEHSSDPGSKEKGGDLGMFGTGVMVKEFEEAVFSAPVGLIDRAVETSHGYHIIEVLEIQEAREVTFAEVEDKVREDLENEKIAAQLEAEFAELRNAADVVTKL
ncbi:MAG TPA: foldase [Firmicutes bacterium]|nr:foldase [Bacillota bacterium]